MLACSDGSGDVQLGSLVTSRNVRNLIAAAYATKPEAKVSLMCSGALAVLSLVHERAVHHQRVSYV